MHEALSEIILKEAPSIVRLVEVLYLKHVPVASNRNKEVQEPNCKVPVLHGEISGGVEIIEGSEVFSHWQECHSIGALVINVSVPVNPICKQTDEGSEKILF